MRLLRFAIYNKETNERIYVDARYNKIMEKLNTLENKENYEIRSKFVSI